jgi:hypothetical protein
MAKNKMDTITVVISLRSCGVLGAGVEIEKINAVRKLSVVIGLNCVLPQIVETLTLVT